jgi:ornithine cyclodeaminase/alanine dehydrogenase-like protein (mu-crystallin family)
VTDVLVLSEDDVRTLLDLDELAAALETALTALSRGEASVPPRVAALSAAGLLGAMPGYVPGLGLGAKLVSLFADNHAKGIPSHQALVAVFDEETGTPRALMDGTHITAVRTAVAAAVSARALAAAHDVVAIIGAGVQGHTHLDAFTHLFAPREIRVVSRTSEHADALAATAPNARVVSSADDAVRGADIVCCCTHSPDPVVLDAWIAPGAHVSSVGVGHELDAATVARADVFVESVAALQAPPAGTEELQGRDPSTVTEIGAVFSGAAPGRSSADAVTVYKSMGHAVEDLAAASVVLARARAQGRGTTIVL